MTEAVAAHPAKWSKAILAAIAIRAAEEAEARPGPLVVLDPFAGVGLERLGSVLPDDWLLLGGELEPEWALAAPGTIVTDARRMPYRAESIDVLVTSPSYGNRFADQYDGNRDSCGSCRTGPKGNRRSTGCRVPDCQALHLMPVSDASPDPHGPCETCSGSGRSPSKRYTYRISLGRKASPGSSTGLHWHADHRGKPYRQLHREAWTEAWRCLAPGALVLVNVSNFPKTVGPKTARRQEVQHVVEWHLTTWLRLGALVVSVEPIRTPRMGHGQNREAKAEAEHLLVLRKPTR